MGCLHCRQEVTKSGPSGWWIHVKGGGTWCTYPGFYGNRAEPTKEVTV
jgi:hypothetical protein